MIRAEGEVDVEEVRKRAAARLDYTEERRQRNIESIAEKAVKYLPSKVSDQPVDPDWAFSFFQEAKDTSNADLQELWARILAHETANPGTCCKRTLSIVKRMELRDALAFKKLCRCLFTAGSLPPFVIALEHGLQEIGLNIDEIHELSQLGLLIQNGPSLSIRPEDVFQFGERRFKSVAANKQPFSTSIYPLTSRGRELLAVADVKLADGYIDALRDHLKAEHNASFELLTA